jgi:hypothetical protein
MRFERSYRLASGPVCNVRGSHSERLKCGELARAAGLRQRFIKALRNGHRQPSAAVRAALTEISAAHARKFLAEPIAVDMDACAPFVKTTAMTMHRR